jgi:hypothetical protein
MHIAPENLLDVVVTHDLTSMLEKQAKRRELFWRQMNRRIAALQCAIHVESQATKGKRATRQIA